MTVKRVFLRRTAREDLRQARDFYVQEAGTAAASRFLGAVETATQLIRSHPQSGSARYAHQLGLPGLRVSPVRDFPYLVFYLLGDEQIEVWRVLHAQRDIPESLSSV